MPGVKDNTVALVEVVNVPDAGPDDDGVTAYSKLLTPAGACQEKFTEVLS